MTSASLEKFQIKTKVSKNVSCKHCVFLNKEKRNGKYCQDLGIIGTSKTCGAYKPNVHTLRASEGSEEVVDLFKAIRALPTDYLPIIASLLVRESKTRTFSKFKILQPVMVVIDGNGEFLSDFVKAYVLDADKEFIRVINKSGTFIAQFPLDSTSIYTLTQFKSVKEKLKKLKKISNPKADRSSCKSSSVAMDEVVPTIDHAIDEGRISKRKLRKSDLYTLFSELNK